jgi:hypothetical protein
LARTWSAMLADGNESLRKQGIVRGL